MNKRKDHLLKIVMFLVIAILCVALAIIIIVYLGSPDRGENEGPRPNFSYKVVDDIKFDYSLSDDILTDDALIDVSLTTDENNETTCTYNIVWEWDENLNINNQYQKPDENAFTIKGSASDDLFEDTEINSYDSDNRITILKNAKIKVSGNQIVTQKWQLIGTFYSLNDGHEYLGHLDIKDVVCTSKAR